jgi:hypothetical protein
MSKRQPRPPGAHVTFDPQAATMREHAREALKAARGAYVEGDPFGPEALHAAVKAVFKGLAQGHERDAYRTLRAATVGLKGAHDALVELDDERSNRPPPVAALYRDFLSEHGAPRFRQPAAKPPANPLANFVIIALLIDLADHFPDAPMQLSTRLRASRCSIIAEVLTEAGLGRGGESSIFKIWRTYGPPSNPKVWAREKK